MCEWNVASPPRRGGKAHPDKPRLYRIKCVGFSIDRDHARKRCFCNPAIKRLNALDAFIGIEIKRRDYRFCSRSGRWPARFLVDQLHRLMISFATFAAELFEQRHKAVMLKKFA